MINILSLNRPPLPLLSPYLKPSCIYVVSVCTETSYTFLSKESLFNSSRFSDSASFRRLIFVLICTRFTLPSISKRLNTLQLTGCILFSCLKDNLRKNRASINQQWPRVLSPQTLVWSGLCGLETWQTWLMEGSAGPSLLQVCVIEYGGIWLMIQRLSLNSQCFGVLPECILNPSWKKMEKIFLWRINYTTNNIWSLTAALCCTFYPDFCFCLFPLLLNDGHNLSVILVPRDCVLRYFFNELTSNLLVWGSTALPVYTSCFLSLSIFICWGFRLSSAWPLHIIKVIIDIKIE